MLWKKTGESFLGKWVHTYFGFYSKTSLKKIFFTFHKTKDANFFLFFFNVSLDEIISEINNYLSRHDAESCRQHFLEFHSQTRRHLEVFYAGPPYFQCILRCLPP